MTHRRVDALGRSPQGLGGRHDSSNRCITSRGAKRLRRARCAIGQNHSAIRSPVACCGSWRKTQPPRERKLRPEDEVDCAPITFDQARDNPVPTNVLVYLITGLGPREIPGFLTKELKAEVQEDREVLYKAKLKFHKEWVEQFPRGKIIITENSGHGIPFEEPDLVVRTVRDVVNETRMADSR